MLETCSFVSPEALSHQQLSLTIRRSRVPLQYRETKGQFRMKSASTIGAMGGGVNLGFRCVGQDFSSYWLRSGAHRYRTKAGEPSSIESAEPAAAPRRIAEPETKLAIAKRYDLYGTRSTSAQNMSDGLVGHGVGDGSLLTGQWQIVSASGRAGAFKAGPDGDAKCSSHIQILICVSLSRHWAHLCTPNPERASSQPTC